jgi:4-amino-4-deoxy-L-arabinose transferase-like glycosyltransferase
VTLSGHTVAVARLRSIPRWGLALGLVLVAGAAWRAHQAIEHGEFLSTDERAYSRLGVALSHGHYDPRGMNDPLHWPPGTPLLFAVARQLTGAADTPLDPPVAYATQAVVGVLLIVAVFALVRLLAGPWPAVAAAAGVALYPPLAVISGDMVSEPLGALTIALVMLALAWAWRAPSPGRFALAGALTGAAVLVRADLLVLPAVLAVVVALTLRHAGARPALLAAGAYLLAAVLALAPWSVYASSRRSEFTPITSSSWSGLFVGTYLPGDGRIFGVREALGDEARAHNPSIRHFENRNLRTEWILDAVAARHPDLGRSDALRRETLRNLRRYALGRPLAFAGMQLGKLDRMWIGYDRGTHHARRGWVLAIHLLLSAAGLTGLLLGLWRTRHPALWAILATVLTVTAVNSFFVSEARHNVRMVPLLVAGGAAGAALALSGRGREARSGPPRARASAAGPPPAARPSDAAGVR